MQLNFVVNIFNGKMEYKPTISLKREAFYTLEHEEKTRREGEVKTNPESKKESGSHKKFTEIPHSGK